jgi:hypothetical protein
MSIKGGALSSHINTRPVHFAGSVPLAGADDVFRTIGSMFGSLAPRIPDGETGPSTRIFLGLIHFTDGLEESLRRLRVAEQFIRDFGVASECGFGRRDPQTIRDLLIPHEAVATAD